MKAYIFEEYGPPEMLQLKEIPRQIPKSDEILIKAYATSVSAADWRLRSFTILKGFGLIFKAMFGYPKPKKQILGSEICGIIEQIGVDVKDFKVGDKVFAFADFDLGCYVEYKVFNQNGLVCHLPQNLSFIEGGAMCFGASTALGFFKRAELKASQKILINGASGAVGTAAVQLAKHFGANITAICSAANAELVKSLGAGRVIDYKTQSLSDLGETFDIIMDNVGNLPFEISKNYLNENGKTLAVVADLPQMLKSIFSNFFGSKKMLSGSATTSIDDLKFLAKLAQNGEYKPVVSKIFAFNEMVEAHHYVDSGHKIGNAVVRINE